jgi:hypothetical protein
MRALLSTLAAVALAAVATDFVIRRHPVKFSTRGAASPGALVAASDPHATLDDAGLAGHGLAPLALGGGVIVLAAFCVVAAAVASIGYARNGHDAPTHAVHVVIGQTAPLPALAAAATITTFFSVCAIVFARRSRARRMTLRRVAFAGWICAALVACGFFSFHRASATAVANGLPRS